MAKIKKSKSKEKKKKKSKLALKKKKVSVTLPTKRSKRSNDIRDYSWLIHGEKKIGKTTLLAEEEDAFFLEWDPEQKALSILQRQIPDWAHFKAYIDELEKAAAKGTLSYKTCVVDGSDIMYRACFKWCCIKMAINHPNEENDYGQSWDFIREEFSSEILRLMRIPGLATRFICHSAWKEREARGGEKFEKLSPILKSQAEETLIGLVDIWAAYLYDGKKRVLVVRGDEQTGAGHRADHRMLTPDGRMVEEIPMGRSAKEAYANLLNAWDNNQTFTVLEERDAAKKKKKKKGGKKKKR